MSLSKSYSKALLACGTAAAAFIAAQPVFAQEGASEQDQRAERLALTQLSLLARAAPTARLPTARFPLM